MINGVDVNDNLFATPQNYFTTYRGALSNMLIEAQYSRRKFRF